MCDTWPQVHSALEAAGFSRANPYNIVQQGKIAQLSLMSDEERLAMIKDIGGASTYEAKRRESQRQMEAQRAETREIDGMVRGPCCPSFSLGCGAESVRRAVPCSLLRRCLGPRRWQIRERAGRSLRELRRLGDTLLSSFCQASSRRSRRRMLSQWHVGAPGDWPLPSPLQTSGASRSRRAAPSCLFCSLRCRADAAQRALCCGFFANA